LLKLEFEEEGSDRDATVWATADAVTSVSLIMVEARAALCAAATRRGLHVANPLVA
jgi:hypothetical protein